MLDTPSRPGAPKPRRKRKRPTVAHRVVIELTVVGCNPALAMREFGLKFKRRGSPRTSEREPIVFALSMVLGRRGAPWIGLELVQAPCARQAELLRFGPKTNGKKTLVKQGAQFAPRIPLTECIVAPPVVRIEGARIDLKTPSIVTGPGRRTQLSRAQRSGNQTHTALRRF